MQVETVTRDAQGNEERRVSHKQDGKQVTVITRIDPSGAKQVQEQVSDLPNGSDPTISQWPPGNFPDAYNSRPGSFFRSSGNMRPDIDSDMQKQLERQMESIIRSFSSDGIFNPFENNDGKRRTFRMPTTEEENNSAQRFVDHTGKELKKYKRRKGNGKENWNQKMDNMFKNAFQRQYPAVFSEIDAKSKVEMAQDTTPFDKYVQLDDDELRERTLQSESVLSRTGQALKKLGDYLCAVDAEPGHNRTDSIALKKMEDELGLGFPSVKRNSSTEAPSFNSDSSRTLRESANFFKDGRSRKEVVRKDKNGNVEKTVTYQVGDKRFEITSRSDNGGGRHVRERSTNLTDDQLAEFARKWGKKYESDFERQPRDEA